MAFTVIGSDNEYRLIGELDLASAPDLLAALQDSVSAGGELRLDVGELTFMDCQGIRMLLELAHALDGGQVVLVNPRGAVLVVLGLTGITNDGTKIRAQMG